MIKLDFAIQKTHAGVQTPTTINGGPWVRSIGDVRSVLELGPDTVKEFTFLRVLPTGSLLYYVKRSEMRGGDNTARVLFVPAEAEISGRAVLELFNRARKSESLEDLRALFQQEYPQKSAGEIVQTNTQTKNCAKLIISTDEQLADYLDRADCQRFNSEYYAIFINVPPVEEIRAEEISPASLRKPIMMRRPCDEAIKKKWGYDIKVALYVNGRELTGPIRCFLGESIQVTARLQGCLPLEFKVTPEFNDQEMPIDDAGDFKVHFTPDMVKVIDENRKPIDSKKVYMQLGSTQVGPEGVKVKYSDAKKKMNLRVSAEGYVDKDGNEYVQTSINPMYPCDVNLKAKETTVKSRIKLVNGKEVNITLSGTGLDPNPQLYGYLNTGNRFEPDNKQASKKANIAVILACLLGLMAGAVAGVGGMLLYQKFFGKPATTQPTQQTAGIDIPKYFNEHDEVTKAELDSLGLTELYDAIVNNKQNELKNSIKDYKEQSNRLSALFAAADNIPKLRDNTDRATYWTHNNRGVEIVKIPQYIEFLNKQENWKQEYKTSVPEPEPAPEASAQGPAPRPGNATPASGDAPPASNLWGPAYLNAYGFSGTESQMSQAGILSLYKKLNDGNIIDFYNDIIQATYSSWSNQRSTIQKLEAYKTFKNTSGQKYKETLGDPIDPASQDYINWLNSVKNPDNDGAPNLDL